MNCVVTSNVTGRMRILRGHGSELVYFRPLFVGKIVVNHCFGAPYL